MASVSVTKAGQAVHAISSRAVHLATVPVTVLALTWRLVPATPAQTVTSPNLAQLYETAAVTVFALRKERVYATTVFYGDACDKFNCSQGCFGRGTCVAPEVCSCIFGWTRLDCSKPSCEKLQFCSGQTMIDTVGRAH